MVSSYTSSGPQLSSGPGSHAFRKLIQVKVQSEITISFIAQGMHLSGAEVHRESTYNPRCTSTSLHHHKRTLKEPRNNRLHILPVFSPACCVA